MQEVGQSERRTQDRVINLLRDKLNFRYLGNFQDRQNNSNVEHSLLKEYLLKAGYSTIQAERAIYRLQSDANDLSGNLYEANQKVYSLLIYGVPVKVSASENNEYIQVINWNDVEANHFAFAEEVTVKGDHTKRPDIVIYINGIAVGILELKRSTVSIGDGIRQSIRNQEKDFIQSFFTTIQFVLAGNDTEGMRYGTIGTPEKYFLKWKEGQADPHETRLDHNIRMFCTKERLLDIMHDFVLFDAGMKKLPRVHQYFGVKAAQEHVKAYKGGIIWHTQGSGKSISMVLLTKWILKNNPNGRVVVLTDRDELDKQIQRVFEDAGETSIHRSSSGRDLMQTLSDPKHRLICSLIHKFGQRDVTNFDAFIKELESQKSIAEGEIFVLVDECHRTQSGKLHRTMKAMLPKAVFIGFTGTPLLKKDKPTSLEVFGKYIHTYKFNEGVRDEIILDLVYEARDIDQQMTSQHLVDEWFELKTRDLNDWQRNELKKTWGTMQKVLSCQSRMEKIVADISIDFSKKQRLHSGDGNAMLVAYSIYEACRYYELFQRSPLKGKVGIVTSYNPQVKDITLESSGEGSETENEYKYALYTELLKDVVPKAGKSKTETYEDRVKELFIKQPAQMKLLIVVSKLLTGFDAPPCTYLYLDKSMQDHGLFQAICRVNRLDGNGKLFGYIVDYKDLFRSVEDAVAVYTSELDYDDFEEKEIDIMLKDRLTAGREKLTEALDNLELLCEPVEMPRSQIEYQHYFCGSSVNEDALKESEPQRMTLYKLIAAYLRAYKNIEDEMTTAGFSEHEKRHFADRLEFYLKLREEIRIASGEKLDTKAYEADMRFMIDQYITAFPGKQISAFEDMPLLDVIERIGFEEAINKLPPGIKSNPEAVAETIDNNVRSRIIDDHLQDPTFFARMSELLDELIRQRKSDAMDYETYLRRIAALASQVSKGKTDNTPETLQTKGQRALYNALGEDEELAIEMDKKIKIGKPDDFRGNLSREKIVQSIIYQSLLERYNNVMSESGNTYTKKELKEMTLELFEIVKKNEEY